MSTPTHSDVSRNRSAPRQAAKLLPFLAGLLSPLAVGATSTLRLDTSAPEGPDAGASERRVPNAVPLTWPDIVTSAPASEQWHVAESVTATRAVGENARRCQIRRVREWASIRCLGLATSAITQLGGTQKGASFHLDEAGEDRLPREGVLVFPLRSGDRRVFSFWTLGDGYDGPLTVIAGVIVQADWQGDAPLLLLHDALNEPVRTARGQLRQATQSERKQESNHADKPATQDKP